MVNFIWNFDNGKIDYACDPTLIPKTHDYNLTLLLKVDKVD